MDSFKKTSVCLFKYVSLCNALYAFLAVCFCVVECHARYALRALCRNDPEINRQVFARLHAETSHDILTLCVFAEERPVYTELRDGYRSYVCEKVELASERDVCAFKVHLAVELIWRCCRALHEHIALLYVFKNIVRQSIVFFYTIFKSQTLDSLHLNFSRLNFICQQMIEDSSCFFHYDRADAVSVYETDHDLFLSGEISSGRFIFHALHSCELILYEFFKIEQISHSNYSSPLIILIFPPASIIFFSRSDRPGIILNSFPDVRSFTVITSFSIWAAAFSITNSSLRATAS